MSENSNNFGKFTFSKTQKIDFKETNKGIFHYMPMSNTNRDNSIENKRKDYKISPIQEERHQYANLLKSKNEKGTSSKRSRGS
jgi:hypothetical protein